MRGTIGSVGDYEGTATFVKPDGQEISANVDLSTRTDGTWEGGADLTFWAAADLAAAGGVRLRIGNRESPVIVNTRSSGTVEGAKYDRVDLDGLDAPPWLSQ